MAAIQSFGLLLSRWLLATMGHAKISSAGCGFAHDEKRFLFRSVQCHLISKKFIPET